MDEQDDQEDPVPVSDPAPSVLEDPAFAPRPGGRRLRLAVAAVVGVSLAAGGAVGYEKWAVRNLNANESAAIAALKNISSAQAQCQASGVIDVNGNGQGEYGFFGELSGQVALRGGSRRLAPPVLSMAFAEVVESRVVRSGYVFQLFLPDKNCAGVAEDPSGGDARDDNGVESGQAEVLWCCYAWPRNRGYSGKRVFFVNQGGDVLATNGSATGYDGASRPCHSGAAFAASSSSSLSAPIAANTLGHDGNIWVVV